MQPKEIKSLAIPLDDVLTMYREAGFDIEDQDAEVPNVLKVGDVEYFFTGDLIPVGDIYLEIVIIADWFSFDDVVSDEDDDLEGMPAGQAN